MKEGIRDWIRDRIRDRIGGRILEVKDRGQDSGTLEEGTGGGGGSGTGFFKDRIRKWIRIRDRIWDRIVFDRLSYMNLYEYYYFLLLLRVRSKHFLSSIGF